MKQTEKNTVNQQDRSAAARELDRLNRLSFGYRQSIVILTANSLRIFDAIVRRTASASSLARKLGLDEHACTVLLDALAALGLLRKEGKAYRCTPTARRHLVSGSPAYLGHMLDHRFNGLASWRELPEVIRSGGPAKARRRKRTAGEHRDLILAMADIGRRSAAETLDLLDLSNSRSMLDLGGGPGTYAITFCRKHRRLRAVVFDRPQTVGIAEEEIERAGMGGRIETRAGDYFTDPIGRGYDLVLMSNIIHSATLPQIRRLLRKVHSSLVRGGCVVVKDFLIDETRTKPLESALFAVNMLVGTPGGNVYTPSEITDALQRAGFVRIAKRPVAAQSALYFGYKRKR